MIAIELFEDGDHTKPDAKLTAEIVARARDKGLILLSCGPYYNVLRILVPLTIEDAQIRRAGHYRSVFCRSEAGLTPHSTNKNAILRPDKAEPPSGRQGQ